MKQALLFITLIGLSFGCRPEEDIPAKPFKPFVLTDSSAIAFQDYLAADGGHWQFTEAIYVRYKADIQGNDTVYTTMDSNDVYLGSGIGPDDLRYYRFKFSKVVSEKDEMNFRFTRFNYYYLNPGSDSSEITAYFDYSLKQIEVGNPAFAYVEPFDTEYLRVHKMEGDHMWLVGYLLDYGYHLTSKQYYKLEKRP